MSKAVDTPTLIAVTQKDVEILMKSASGGVFTQIVQWFLSKGDGFIYGAAMNRDLKVKHICSWNHEKIDEIRGSKYVISDTDNCFHKIKDQLSEGYRVLFSGTPCQVAALRNVVGENDKLVCVDLVCHGAPSQKLFNDYVRYEENNLKKKIIKIQFHHKIYKRKKWTIRNILITTKDGKNYPMTRFQSDYLRAYHQNLMNRDSCYECVFSKPERYGDITIGDFWGIEKFYQQLIVERGVSICSVNTKVGMEISEYLEATMDYYTIDRDKYVTLFRNSLAQSGGIKMNPQRHQFLNIEKNQGFRRAVSKILPFHKDQYLYYLVETKRKIKRVLRKHSK